MLKAFPSVFVSNTAWTIFPTRMASRAATTIVIGAVSASATSSTVDQPANSAYALKSRRPVLDSSREHRQWDFKVRAHILNHPATRTLSHLLTGRLSSPEDFGGISHEPRKTAMDAFHKFQQSSRLLNKTFAPPPCQESTKQNVSDVYCASEP